MSVPNLKISDFEKFQGLLSWLKGCWESHARIAIRNPYFVGGMVFFVFACVCAYFVQARICAGRDWSVSLKESDLKFIFVQAGNFIMGCNDETFVGIHAPPKQISVEQYFWMTSTEVTVEQYREFAIDRTWQGTDENPFRGVSVWGNGMFLLDESLSWENVFADNVNNPVAGVSWYDALEFCRWLTERERSMGRLSKNYKYTLPTEVQWEYACKAKDSEADVKGNELSCWSSENSNNSPHPVAMKIPNSWGFYDMHGNVWEWCLDPYTTLIDEQKMDAASNDSQKAKVIKGGSWYNSGSFCHACFRDGNLPEERVFDIGFRIVCQPTVPNPETMWDRAYQFHRGALDLMKAFLNV